MNEPTRRTLIVASISAAVAFASPRSATPETDPAEEGAQREASAGQSSSEEGGKAADTQTSETTDSEETKPEADDPSDDDASESPSGASATRSEPVGTSYQMEELVRRARTNEDLLAEFEAKRDKAEWDRYRAKWANAPKIESLTTLAPVPDDADPDRLQNNYDEIGNLNIGPFVNQSLELIVPIYTFGRIKTLRELADVGVDVSQLKKEEAQLNAIFQTKRAYYSLQLSRAFEPILEEGDSRIEEKLEEMEDARDFGTADFETKDLRKLQIFSAEVDSRIVDNEKLESVSTSGLKYLADLEDQRLAVGELDTEGEPPELATFDVYLEAAKRHRPDLRQLNHALEARELQVRLEKREFYPNLFASGGIHVGWSTESTALQRVCRRDSPEDPTCENTEDLWARPDSDPLDRFSVKVGLGLRWKLDIVGQHGKVQKKKAQLRALKAQRRRALGAVKVEIRKLYTDAYDQLRKVDINDRRLEAARRWRDQMGLTMQSAAGQDLDDMEDALDPLKAYYQAKAKALESRYRYQVARAALAQAVGVQNLRQVESTAASEAGESSEKASSAGPAPDQE